MPGRSSSRPAAPPGLAVTAAGISFQNPIVLAAGTAGYGRELADVMDLDDLGGLVTKAVSLGPRGGAPAPRVGEFDGGMINAVGLANPGLEEVCRDQIPWLAANLPRARKLVNVVGNAVEEFVAVVEGLDAAAGPVSGGAGGVHAYELNVSCPNVKAGGMEFGADPRTLAEVVRRVRAATARPIFVKLSPALPDIAAAAQTAADAGADGLTLVNTMPGLVIDVERRRPVLGFGRGGVSGTSLLPVGVLATWKVSRVVRLPLIGVGGVSTASDVVQYMLAGATLVGVGTAALRNPRTPGRLVRELGRWCEATGVASISTLVGALEWPA